MLYVYIVERSIWEHNFNFHKTFSFTAESFKNTEHRRKVI